MEHKRPGHSALTPESQALAARIFRSPVSQLARESWPRNRAVDLRRFTLEALERHIERRLTTAAALARLGG
jgi:DNA repair protein RecO (recombination protein O)